MDLCFRAKLCNVLFVQYSPKGNTPCIDDDNNDDNSPNRDLSVYPLGCNQANHMALETVAQIMERAKNILYTVIPPRSKCCLCSN